VLCPVVRRRKGGKEWAATTAASGVSTAATVASSRRSREGSDRTAAALAIPGQLSTRFFFLFGENQSPSWPAAASLTTDICFRLGPCPQWAVGCLTKWAYPSRPLICLSKWASPSCPIIIRLLPLAKEAFPPKLDERRKNLHGCLWPPPTGPRLGIATSRLPWCLFTNSTPVNE
jgi:hypothetical protein